MALRPYQREAVRRIVACISAGKRRIVVVAPTGSGKSVIVADIAIRTLANQRRVLAIAHRIELIKQLFCKIIRAGVDPKHVGIILSGTPDAGRGEPTLDLSVNDDTLWSRHARRRPSAPCQVASVDTLRNRALPLADVIFIDEGHRSLSPSYLRIIEHYTALGAVILALTATPCRTDNRGLGEVITSARLDDNGQPITYPVYQELVVVSSYAELARAGYLVEPRVWTVPAKDLPDLAHVRIAGSDYDPADLSAAVDQEGLIGNIVEHWKTHGNNAPTIFAGVNRSHATKVRDRFLADGIPASYVDGDSDKSIGGERERAFADFAAGKFKILCNVDVCTEGTDLPFVKTIILGTPTKSLRKYLQICGRGSRPFENHPFTILDHAGCSLEPELGLPQMDREWSLTPPPKRRRASPDMPRTKTCPECYAVVAAQQRVCGAMKIDGSGVCSHTWTVEARSLDEQKGHLIEIVQVSETEKLDGWKEIIAGRGKRGAAWCAEQFRSKYRCPLPREWLSMVEPRVSTEAEKRRDWERYCATAKAEGWKPAAALNRYYAKHGERPKEEWNATTDDARGGVVLVESVGVEVANERANDRGRDPKAERRPDKIVQASTTSNDSGSRSSAGGEEVEIRHAWRDPEANQSSRFAPQGRAHTAPRKVEDVEEWVV